MDDEIQLPKKKLTIRELTAIEEQASAIQDDETRQAFADLMKASLENNYSKEAFK